MDKTWYEKNLLQIKDIKSSLNDLKEQLLLLPQAKKVYVFGSVAEHFDEPNYRINDIDIIVSTKLNADDLISVSKDSLSYKEDVLINEGYSPDAIRFTKEYTKLNHLPLDRWAIAGKKLLHYGPIFASIEDSFNAKSEAQEIADKNCPKAKKTSASVSVKKSWYFSYLNHINMQFEDMPDGWYCSKESTSNILKNAKEL